MNNDDFMKRILDKLDTVDEKVDRIDSTLKVQQVILDEHTRRSTTLEEEFKPIRASVLQIQGVLKFITVLGTLIAIAVGLQKLFS